MKSLHIENSRPSLLLALHGFTGDAYDFSELYEDSSIPAIWRFADLPGHFRYGQVVPGTEQLWADFCTRIDQVMREAKETGLRVYVLAYSMGVRLFLKALLERRWKPDGLILIGATAGLESALDRAERLKHDQALAENLKQQGIDSFIDDWMGQPIIASQQQVSTPERIRRKKLLNADALADALVEYSQGRLPPVWDRLGEISIRTCLVAGENDSKYLALHYRMVAQLPHAEIRVIADAGHAPHLEQSAAFREVLASCLG